MIDFFACCWYTISNRTWLQSYFVWGFIYDQFVTQLCDLFIHIRHSGFTAVGSIVWLAQPPANSFQPIWVVTLFCWSNAGPMCTYHAIYYIYQMSYNMKLCLGQMGCHCRGVHIKAQLMAAVNWAIPGQSSRGTAYGRWWLKSRGCNVHVCLSRYDMISFL